MRRGQSSLSHTFRLPCALWCPEASQGEPRAPQARVKATGPGARLDICHWPARCPASGCDNLNFIFLSRLHINDMETLSQPRSKLQKARHFPLTLTYMVTVCHKTPSQFSYVHSKRLTKTPNFIYDKSLLFLCPPPISAC